MQSALGELPWAGGWELGNDPPALGISKQVKSYGTDLARASAGSHIWTWQQCPASAAPLSPSAPPARRRAAPAHPEGIICSFAQRHGQQHSTKLFHLSCFSPSIPPGTLPASRCAAAADDALPPLARSLPSLLTCEHHRGLCSFMPLICDSTSAREQEEAFLML